MNVKKSTSFNGLCLAAITLVFISLLTPCRGNWYGKRGEKVDNGLLQLLQGTIPDIVDRQLDAQMTLQAIAKIIEDYEIRQLEGLPGKSANK